MKALARRLAGIAATAIVITASLTFSAAQASAQEITPTGDLGAQTDCSHSWSIKDGRTGSTVADGVNIRSGPHSFSPTCTIVGQAQAFHSLRFDCWVMGGVFEGSWSHVRDYNTGVEGWIRDDLLSGNGANSACY